MTEDELSAVDSRRHRDATLTHGPPFGQGSGTHAPGAGGRALEDVDGWVGRRLDGRYVLRRLIAQGTMAAVFEGEHLGLGRRVAIKVLPHGPATSASRSRFAREAEILSQLQHEHVVGVVEFVSEVSGLDFLVMEYLEGRTLKDARREPQARTWGWTKSAILQILAALEAVHARNIVHRDVKPSNCFCVGFGADTLPSIKLLDFGVSKMEVSGDPTTAGVVLGTASYMAPEQARGIPVDTRADVYAVGVLLYEMVTGSVPFSGEDFFETMWRHVYCAPLPPRQAHPELPVSPALEALILSALHKDPERRIQTAREFSDALRAIEPVERLPGQRRPSGGGVAEEEHSDIRRALDNLAKTRLSDMDPDGWGPGVSIRQVRTLEPDDVDAFWPHDVAGVENAAHQSLPAHVRTVDVFQRMGCRLLLLGQPGAGKTFRLLEIAAEMHARLSRDPALRGPLPVVLELSSWRPDRESLQAFMTHQLHRVERFPTARITSWLEQHRLLPLLDGLDQLSPELLPAAIDRINRFMVEASPPGLVVTCVSEVYRSLPHRLQCSGALELHRLDLEDLGRSLGSLGPDGKSLALAIERHPSLQGLVQVPLGCRIALQVAQSPEGLERLCEANHSLGRAYDVFVAQLLKRRTLSIPVRPMLHALAELAVDLRTFNTPVLRMDTMQPMWLRARWRRWLYIVMSRGVVGCCLGFSYIMAIARTPLDNGGLETNPAVGLRFGIGTSVGLFVAHYVSAFTLSSKSSPCFVRSPWIHWGLTTLLSAVVGMAVVGELSTRAPLMVSTVVALGSAVFCFGKGSNVEMEDIKLLDVLQWAPGRLKRRLPWVLLVSLVMVGVASLTEDSTAVGLIGLLYLSVGAALASFRKTIAPAEHCSLDSSSAIRKMGRGAVWAGLLAFGVTASLFSWSYGLDYAFWAALPVGAGIALWYGGVSTISHQLLRALLKRERTYLQSDQWLSAATQIGLLEHGMGGIRFLHPSFAEYFASKVADDPTRPRLSPTMAEEASPSLAAE